MNLHLNPMTSAIASILACSLLAACGGGSGGMVRNAPAPQSPPPASTPPPPPPPTTTGPCQAPITGDCVVTLGIVGGWGTSDLMTGGRQSDHALVLRVLEPATLALVGDYRFSGGTRIESGGLYVWDLLESDVTIAGTSDVYDPSLLLFGTVRGNVNNDSWMGVNNRSCTSSGCAPTARIEGNYRQSSGATYYMMFGRSLQITGRADLEGGTLELSPANAPPPGWTIPPFPSSQLILHADGGVFGQFAGWKTHPTFLITGSLRYGSNDVWFDLTRLSVQAAVSSNGIRSPLTLASAVNLDQAFSRIDRLSFAAPTALNEAQRHLLASANSVLYIADLDQATRTLDSLSGAKHADALHSTLQHGIADPATGQRLSAMQPGFAAGAWSKTSAHGSVSGFDQWLSPRLLVGVQAGQGSGSAHDTLGQSTRLSPQAGAYLRWFGDDGWYAGGSAGYAQHTLALDRTIDLDRGGQWHAHARHRFNVAGLQGEAGRRLSFARGTLTPYVALEATALRSERTIEQGGTGFELALQPSMQAQLGAGLGLRYGRAWRLGDTGWMRLDADARLQRRLADAGDPLRAAYVGMPDLWFDVPGTADATSGWLDLGVRGGFGRDWTWSFAHAQPLAGPGAGQWSIGLQRRF